MATLKTYNVTTDIASGVVDSDSLHKSISLTSYVTGFKGLRLTGDTLDVLGSSLANETALDSLILAHDGISKTPSITSNNKSLTTSERDAITNPEEGLSIFNNENKVFEGYDGVAWVPLSTAR